jgi:hypothetical protein
MRFEVFEKAWQDGLRVGESVVAKHKATEEALAALTRRLETVDADRDRLQGVVDRLRGALVLALAKLENASKHYEVGDLDEIRAALAAKEVGRG